MPPVSRDPLLRVVRRRALPLNHERACVVGLDNFAWKRGQRHGTLLCDLEQRRITDLLPDREAKTAEAWLAVYLEITIVSSDHGHGTATANAAPQVVQVAEHWHLMGNASSAFLEAIWRSMRAILLGSTKISPALPSGEERIPYDGLFRRQDSSQIAKGLAGEGVSIKKTTEAACAHCVGRGDPLDVSCARETRALRATIHSIERPRNCAPPFERALRCTFPS
ncbi:MAG TPA: transposase [Acetobacteraceae bacterium]|nr:transposase [Acetobacteraceae bacterium]